MVNKAKVVLIVDDEIHIAALLETNLELEGYQTIVVHDGQSAIDVIEERHIDLVLLDVMLPNSSGIDICKKIKRERSTLPILMLSALGQSSDRIKGLKSGADDYLGKPFNLTELYLRMDNLLARYQDAKKSDIHQIKLGAATIDLDNSLIINKGKSFILSAKEIDLLRYMINRPNEVIHRKEMLDNVWGYEVYPTTRTVDNFIAKFRKLIETNPNTPTIIKSIRGVGYMLLR